MTCLALSSIFNFIFGFITCLSIVWLYWRRTVEDADIAGSSKIYLNVFFNNRKEVVENIVRRKIARNRIVLRAVAKRVAVNFVTDEKLLQKIGDDLCNTIPEKLRINGIESTTAKVYQQSAYLCVEVKIAVNLQTFLEATAGIIVSEKFRKLVEFVNVPIFKQFLEIVMSKVVIQRILNSLPITIKEKLEDKLVADVEIVALGSHEQGSFFLQTIQNLGVSVSNIES